MDASLVGGVAVLERAIAYALGALAEVTPEALGRPTPCRRWNLYDLLEHVDDSLVALQEAAQSGRVGGGVPYYVPGSPVPPLHRPGRRPGGEVVPRVRAQAVRLLGSWTNADDAAVVCVGEVPMSAPLIAGAGALEVTVHGWDVAQACGRPRPIPAHLADELLDLAVLFVRPADRPGRFARPIELPPGAPPADRLLAFLGRQPWPPAGLIMGSS